MSAWKIRKQLLSVIVLIGAASTAYADPQHAFAFRGTPKYPADFKQFDYADPHAVVGGELRLSAIGSFDSFNPFPIQGTPAAGISTTFETLMTSSLDEASTEYGLLAETIELADDNTWVEFKLRSAARFHDGSKITAQDAVFSFNLLRSKGRPHYRAYYADIDRVEARDAEHVRFYFKNANNPELPLILGQLPVLSAAYWSERDFEKTTLEAPLGSGPYKISSFEPGRYIVYERVNDYWGKDLSVNRGANNFQRIRYDYYRDANIALEAFKAGAYDFRREISSKLWATGYASPALSAGHIIQEAIPNQNVNGMQGFLFNLRKPLFQDRKVRQALNQLFDFEWSNKNLFYGAYYRTNSYFANSELAASELPDAAELSILEPLRGKIPDEVFTHVFKASSTDGSGNIREQIRNALKLLKAAGWEIDSKSKQLVNTTSKQAFEFELLIDSDAMERIALPFKQNLARVGITMNVRLVDSAQYQKRMDEFDYDMIVGIFGQSMSPGNEQRDFWSSVAADQAGSQNYIGIKDPSIDKLIESLINAKTREDLIHHVRALDRVLLWNYFVIPHFHDRNYRVAYWDKLVHPKVSPPYGLSLMNWWLNPNKTAAPKQP